MPEIVIGIVLALFVYEYAGWSPGGIITAGYVALYFHHWQFVAGTIAVALVSVAVVRLLGRYMVLYGKRLFCVYLLVALLLSRAAASFSGLHAGGMEFAAIGYLIPGLIAKDIHSQGAVPTLASLALTVGLIRIADFAGRGMLW